jgi:hypothetical protein
VEIDAPAAVVWSWVAQIGQDRGGLYSYAWLENLAGCRMRNADRVHPEWQPTRSRRAVSLHPATGREVLRFEPGRAMVLKGGWSLVMLDDGPHFVMERKMLPEIKRRAERVS